MKPDNQKSPSSNRISRRDFVRMSVTSIAALGSGPVPGCLASTKISAWQGPASRVISLDQDWLFALKFNQVSLDPGFNDSTFKKVTLPHCVTNLSWQNWDPEKWQSVWVYRRYFSLSNELKGMRVFLHFDGVMVGAIPTINGHTLSPHIGGYLPFMYEITDWMNERDNLLTVEVDSRWSNVPPQGSQNGTKSIDYLEPGGIHRSVWLQVVPQIFINDVFAKPVNVLDPSRYIVITCSVDSAVLPDKSVSIEVAMKKGKQIFSRSRQLLNIEKTGQTEFSLTLSNLGAVTLWDTESPYLYEIATTLSIEGKPIHNHQIHIGLRDARFELDGFFLNGRRLQIFGLNRHEIFPYVGFAMPERVMRRDAEILRHEFNCNMVRCSHYPQTEAFLDACDEFGLLVWEEIPGWQYLGDDAWKELMIRDLKEMIIRDRNHPSIIIWGTRINESNNDTELYHHTKTLAKLLDDSRPSSGSMTPGSRKNWEKEWDEDVFAFDDYHSAPDGSVGIRPATEGVPYMLAEAVGQFNYAEGKGFNCMYRRDAEPSIQQLQALYHAQAHNKAAATPQNCGVIAWCAFEYASLLNSYKGIKNPGIADVFRIPKLGASFYQSQCDPKLTPVIRPNFYWYFGSKSPKGPGKNVAIFSNCEKLELFIDGHLKASLYPDFENFPNLQHPPFFVDLKMEGVVFPELRIDGYLTGKLATSSFFSSDPVQDQLLLEIDDTELSADGVDATRLIFRVADKFGAARPFTGGNVNLIIDGPGIIVGDNPFNLDENGGAGAVWVKTVKNKTGRIKLTAINSLFLGEKSVTINVNKV